jgi:hypothetical protein
MQVAENVPVIFVAVCDEIPQTKFVHPLSDGGAGAGVPEGEPEAWELQVPTNDVVELAGPAALFDCSTLGKVEECWKSQPTARTEAVRTAVAM